MSSAAALFEPEEPAETVDDVLLELAARIESDGGLSGRDQSGRVVASLIALLLYGLEGHTDRRGAFKSHVGRLLAFLGAADLSEFTDDQRRCIGAVLATLDDGNGIQGPWLDMAQSYLKEGDIPDQGSWWREIMTHGPAEV